jgi:hypothetical protein
VGSSFSSSTQQKLVTKKKNTNNALAKFWVGHLPRYFPNTGLNTQQVDRNVVEVDELTKLRVWPEGARKV